MTTAVQMARPQLAASSEVLGPLSAVGRVMHALSRGEEAPIELFSPDFRQYGPGRDLFGAGERTHRTFEPFAGFEDVELRVRRFVARGDKVLVYISFSGLSQATADGPPRRRTADGYLSFRLANGLIREQWSVLRWSH